jgi:hypothetical protein
MLSIASLKKKNENEQGKKRKRKPRSKNANQYKANIYDFQKLLESCAPGRVTTVSEGERITDEQYELEKKKDFIDPKYITVFSFGDSVYRFCLTDQNGDKRDVTHTMLVGIHKAIPWKKLPKNENGSPINPLVEWPHRAGPKVGCKQVPVAPLYDTFFFRNQLLSKIQGKKILEKGEDVFKAHCKPVLVEEGVKNSFCDLIRKRGMEAKERRKKRELLAETEKSPTEQEVCTFSSAALDTKKETKMPKQRMKGMGGDVCVKNFRSNVYERKICPNICDFDPAYPLSRGEVNDLVKMYLDAKKKKTTTLEKRKRPVEPTTCEPEKKSREREMPSPSVPVVPSSDVQVLVPGSAVRNNPFLCEDLLKNMKVSGEIKSPFRVFSHIMNIMQGISMESVGKEGGARSQVDEINKRIKEGMDASMNYDWTALLAGGTSISDVVHNGDHSDVMFAVDRMNPQWFFWISFFTSLLMRRDVVISELFKSECELSHKFNLECQELVKKLEAQAKKCDKAESSAKEAIHAFQKKEQEAKRIEHIMQLLEDELQSARSQIEELKKGRDTQADVNSLSAMMM